MTCRSDTEGLWLTVALLRSALADLLELHEDEPDRPAVELARRVPEDSRARKLEGE